MNYKKRIKLLKFIQEIMSTSDESRKYIYGLISSSETNKLGVLHLSRSIIKIEDKHNNAIIATRIYTKPNLELLLEAINIYNNKEEHSNIIKMMMNLIVVGSKDGILSKHKIIAIKKGFKVESSGLFTKSSHNLTPAMLEYVISNGEIKKDSQGNIPSHIVDSLIESVLEFNSSKNSHDKFLSICGKTSIKTIEDIEAELKNIYRIKNKIPQYIIDLAYSISIGSIVIARNDRLIISYKNKEHQMVRANIDLWEYKLFLNSLLRGESIVEVINSFTSHTVKKI